MTHQDVAEEREDDDEGVSHDEQRFHRGVLGLGPVAPPAHKVLPVGEGVVVPEEVRGIGRGRGRRQARAVLPASGALRGPRQGEEEEEQRPARDHFAGASAPGNAPSGCPRRAAGGRGEARALRGGTPGALRAQGAPARPDLQPRIRARSWSRTFKPLRLRRLGSAARLAAPVTRSPAPRAPTRDENCDRASEPGSPERTRLLGFCFSLVLAKRAAWRLGELGWCRAPRREPVCAPGPPCWATRMNPTGLRGASNTEVGPRVLVGPGSRLTRTSMVGVLQDPSGTRLQPS